MRCDACCFLEPLHDMSIDVVSFCVVPMSVCSVIIEPIVVWCEWRGAWWIRFDCCRVSARGSVHQPQEYKCFCRRLFACFG